MACKIDLHMHSTVSDGTDTPEELLGKVRTAGITYFSLTDHDAVKGNQLLKPLLNDDAPTLVHGVEFSCMDDYGKYHILGYRYDPDAPAINELVQTAYRNRMKKLQTRLNKLDSEFGIVFSESEVKYLLSIDNPGKPHIANLMIRRGLANSIQQAGDLYIDRIPGESTYLRPEEAIEGILLSGGIPVLAHPAFGSGGERILGMEMENRLKRLTTFGLKGLEAFYSGLDRALQREMIDHAERFGLYITAGSDYHGANKQVVLGDTGLSGTLPPGLKDFCEAVGMPTDIE